MLKIAVPTQGQSFASHFGGAERFSIYEVDEDTRAVVACTSAVPPPHERGAFPRWLRQQGANVVLAGGMGPSALQILDHFGIETVLGVAGGEPDKLVRAYLDGTLAASGEGCGGGGLHGCGHDHHA